MPEPTLRSLLDAAQRTGRPIFLYFTTSRSPYYGGQQRLDSLLLHPAVVAVIGRRYIFAICDRANSAGLAVATQLRIDTINPTLVFLTPQGQLTYKWQIQSYEDIAGWSAPALANWLDVYATADSSQSSDQVFEAATAETANLALQVKAAQRSWALGDYAAAKRWLKAVDEADTTPQRGVAARAAWQSTLLELDEEYRSRGQRLAREYLQRFPSHGLPAVRLLAAMGATAEEINEGIVSIVKSTVFGRNAENGATVTCIDINSLVFDSLDLGAYDAALVAAEAHVDADPENPNAYDTLAQVQAARGAYDDAISTARQGLQRTEDVSPMADTLRSTIRDAQNRTAPDIGGTSTRQLRQSLITIPGEGKLFYEQLPYTRLRCELQSSVSDLLRTDDNLPREAVLRVRVGSGKSIEDVQILTTGLPDNVAALLRSRVLELPVSFNAAGLEVNVLASARRQALNSGCGCQ
jgi:tetratricopeptide (TPR) repeat protein